METLYRQVYDAALAARMPVLVSHAKPDGDTLGSMLAFGAALDLAGRPHLRYCRDQAPKEYGFMSGVERIISDAEEVVAVEPDVVIVFDCGDLRYAGVDTLVPRLGNVTLVNIDHHPSNERYGKLNLVIPTASSTSEIVHSLLVQNGVTIDRDIATCLLAGICFDTSNFSNPATSAAVMKVGADLLRRGAKFRTVLKHFVGNKSVPMLRLWGLALSRLTLNKDYDVASTVITQDDLTATGADEEMCGGVTNFLNAVLDVPTVLMLTELPGGYVKGSFRTTGDIDVSKLAKTFGGGGHKKAAGFTIKGRLVEKEGVWTVETSQ